MVNEEGTHLDKNTCTMFIVAKLQKFFNNQYLYVFSFVNF